MGEREGIRWAEMGRDGGEGREGGRGRGGTRLISLESRLLSITYLSQIAPGQGILYRVDRGGREPEQKPTGRPTRPTLSSLTRPPARMPVPPVTWRAFSPNHPPPMPAVPVAQPPGRGAGVARLLCLGWERPVLSMGR